MHLKKKQETQQHCDSFHRMEMQIVIKKNRQANLIREYDARNSDRNSGWKKFQKPKKTILFELRILTNQVSEAKNKAEGNLVAKTLCK